MVGHCIFVNSLCCCCCCCWPFTVLRRNLLLLLLCLMQPRPPNAPPKQMANKLAGKLARPFEISRLGVPLSRRIANEFTGSYTPPHPPPPSPSPPLSASLGSLFVVILHFGCFSLFFLFIICEVHRSGNLNAKWHFRLPKGRLAGRVKGVTG